MIASYLTVSYHEIYDICNRTHNVIVHWSVVFTFGADSGLASCARLYEPQELLFGLKQNLRDDVSIVNKFFHMLSIKLRL